mmetsp:Transcript_183175/g.580735  ORF Transcript_183175/g.580735 Transcript_183175/m.580735 type:complete len:510 (-) Transcript_183175:57-1586(-)
MAPSGAALKLVGGLREISHLYRGFLFDVALISGTAYPQQTKLVTRCARALLEREKRVAVVAGAAGRAASLISAARSAGLPEGIQGWSSGEFVHRGLAAGSLREALPFLPEDRPPKIFELSSLAKPRRWAEFMARGAPPLTDLGKAGTVKRLEGLEEADLCYWDASEGDEITYLETTLELCAESKVPLVQVRRGTAAARALAASHRKGSAEAGAQLLQKLGGKSFGIGKLAGLPEGLGWMDDFSPQDILLVTGDVGDVLEASELGIDSLLLLGDQAHSQLNSFKASSEQEKAVQRKTMSVSQRVAEDSPGMLAAAGNPLLSVFKLPSLLAEATRKNAEHRAAKAAEETQAQQRAVEAKVGKDGPAAPRKPVVRQEVPSAASSSAEISELLERWCRVHGAARPAAVLPKPPLRWDPDEADDVGTGTGGSSGATGGGAAAAGGGGRRRSAATAAALASEAAATAAAQPWRGGDLQLPDPLMRSRGSIPDEGAESLDDILGAIGDRGPLDAVR